MCLKRSTASKMATRSLCGCNTQTFHFTEIYTFFFAPVSHLLRATGQVPKCNVFCIFFKLYLKHLFPPPSPQRMNTGGSVGCRKAAVFNWMFLGAIFENLKYKTTSPSSRAGVFQQTYLHSAKANGRSGSKGKTTLLQKKPKQLPSICHVAI